MGPATPQPLVQPIVGMGQQIQQTPQAAPNGMDPQLAALFAQMAQPRSQGNVGGLTSNMLAQAILDAKYRQAKQAAGPGAGQADPMQFGTGGGGMGQMPTWPSNLPPIPAGGFGG